MRIVKPIVDSAPTQMAASMGLAIQLWKTNSHKSAREIPNDHLPHYWHQRSGESHGLF